MKHPHGDSEHVKLQKNPGEPGRNDADLEQGLAPAEQADGLEKGASKDPRDFGNNGNPAQSAARPSTQEQNAAPAPLSNPIASDPDLKPEELSEDEKKRLGVAPGRPEDLGATPPDPVMIDPNNPDRTPAGENI